MIEIKYPNGSIQHITLKQFSEMEHKAEEFDCINMFLDDLYVPHNDTREGCKNEPLSTVGRIKFLIGELK